MVAKCPDLSETFGVSPLSKGPALVKTWSDDVTIFTIKGIECFRDWKRGETGESEGERPLVRQRLGRKN